MKTKRILALMIMSVSTATGLWAQIDVHSHAITASYMDFIKAHGAEMDEGFPIPGWNVEEHLAFMDQAGIETAVLTMPAPQPWFGNGAESAAFCRKYNEECAALKARYPGRFLFCAALPLPDVKQAVEEAIYALDVLHADGVKLATNSYGQYLGDPELEPLMAVLNARKAVIITHPHKPSAVNDKLRRVSALALYFQVFAGSRLKRLLLINAYLPRRFHHRELHLRDVENLLTAQALHQVVHRKAQVFEHLLVDLPVGNNYLCTAADSLAKRSEPQRQVRKYHVKAYQRENRDYAHKHRHADVFNRQRRNV